jgi:hypothetical protein
MLKRKISFFAFLTLFTLAAMEHPAPKNKEQLRDLILMHFFDDYNWRKYRELQTRITINNSASDFLRVSMMIDDLKFCNPDASLLLNAIQNPEAIEIDPTTQELTQKAQITPLQMMIICKCASREINYELRLLERKLITQNYDPETTKRYQAMIQEVFKIKSLKELLLAAQ